MELRSALTWRDEVEAALERLLGVVAARAEASARTATPKATRSGRHALRRASGDGPESAQAMKSASSLSSAALGRAPTIDFTTSPSL